MCVYIVEINVENFAIFGIILLIFMDSFTDPIYLDTKCEKLEGPKSLAVC